MPLLSATNLRVGAVAAQRAYLGTAQVWTATPGSTPANYTYMRGVNTQGGGGSQENPARIPGTLGTDYFYNSQAFYDYIYSRGHRIVRLDFLWERVQQTLGGPIDATKMSELKAAVQRAANSGLLVLLDMKNYARYWLANDTQVMIGNGITPAQFADAWAKIVAEFADQPAIAAWGIMNEPHDLPTMSTAPTTSSFSGTIRNDWNDGTIQGWTGDNATATNVNNKLRLVQTAPASGYHVMRKDDAGKMRGGALTGKSLRARVTLAAGVTGNWTVDLQWQNASYQWQTGANTIKRVDTGATVGALVPGVECEVTSTWETAWTPRAFAVQLANSNAAGQVVTVDVDDFAQGDIVSGVTATTTYWKQASQAAVDAIRATGDTRTIFIPGDHWSGVWNWTQAQGTPWITDPANNIVYEAHMYLDHGRGGQYEGKTYAGENTKVVNDGGTSLLNRTIQDIGNFTGWLTTHNQRGFIGELGWPNHESTAEWNALGQAVYERCNTAGVGITYWGTGETLSGDVGAENWYNQDPYHRGTQSPQAQTLVIEAPDNLSKLRP